MTYTVLTTFNQAGLEQYAQRMLDTFAATWPQTVELWAYAEACTPQVQANNIKVLDLLAVSQDLVRFKQRWRTVPHANGNVSADPVRGRRRDAHKSFKWDAIRFSHKVYSVFHAANNVATDWLIWMDADMVCHTPIEQTILDRMCPRDRDLCFLGRRGKFSECGLYAMNLKHAATRQFLEEFQRCYDQAETGIFEMAEWHDSFVFDQVRSRVSLNELDWSSHIIAGEGHPLINTEWGAYLDHLKGARKKRGRSASTDLKVPRSESYWQ